MDDAPRLDSSLLWVMSDFALLESERVNGMGLGAIPVTRMFEYLAWTAAPRELWDEAVAYWHALDREALRHYSERQQKASAPKVKPGELSAGRRVVSRSDYPEG